MATCGFDILSAPEETTQRNGGGCRLPSLSEVVSSWPSLFASSENARRIYRHHQRPVVETLDRRGHQLVLAARFQVAFGDRLLNEVIDKSLFDLALEVCTTGVRTLRFDRASPSQGAQEGAPRCGTAVALKAQ